MTELTLIELERAALNRKIVAEKLYTCAYIQVENALKRIPSDGELPHWFPKGVLPFVDYTELLKRETKDMV